MSQSSVRVGLLIGLLGFSAIATLGCRSYPPMTTVPYVDLEQFSGDWYVIAHIPTFIEDEAYNAVESYEVAEDGTIATTFRFNEGSLDGPEKIYEPRGFVRDPASNAVWGMRFIWPFKAEFRIAYLDAEYTQTVVGRTKRDYVWIMARTPSIPEPDLQRLLAFIEAEGYDRSQIRRVPHSGS